MRTSTRFAREFSSLAVFSGLRDNNIFGHLHCCSLMGWEVDREIPCECEDRAEYRKADNEFDKVFQYIGMLFFRHLYISGYTVSGTMGNIVFARGESGGGTKYKKISGPDDPVMSLRGCRKKHIFTKFSNKPEIFPGFDSFLRSIFQRFRNTHGFFPNRLWILQ